MWKILNIEPTTDLKAIRKAYATELRKIDPKMQQAQFQALKFAFDRALAWAKQEKNRRPVSSNFSEEQVSLQEGKAQASSSSESWSFSESSHSLIESESSDEDWSLASATYSLSAFTENNDSEFSPDSWSLSETPSLSVSEKTDEPEDDWSLPEADMEEEFPAFVKIIKKQNIKKRKQKKFRTFLAIIGFYLLFLLGNFLLNSDDYNTTSGSSSSSSSLNLPPVINSNTPELNLELSSELIMWDYMGFIGRRAPEMIEKRASLSDSDFQAYIETLDFGESYGNNEENLARKLQESPQFSIMDVSLGTKADDGYISYSVLSEGGLSAPIIVQDQIVAYFYLAPQSKDWELYSKIWNDSETLLAEAQREYDEGKRKEL